MDRYRKNAARYKWRKWICLLIAGCQFSCLEEQNEEEKPIIETFPSASYVVNGIVRNAQGEVLPNRKVIFTKADFPYNHLTGDTLRSDENGQFVWTKEYVTEVRDYEAQWQVRDSLNEYADQCGIVSFKDATFEGSDGDYYGKATLPLTITLVPFQAQWTEPYVRYYISGKVTNENGRGVVLVYLTDKKTNGRQPSDFLAITDENGAYSFTYEKQPSVGDSLLLYTSAVKGYETGWTQNVPEDSVAIHFDEIPLERTSEGLCIGKGYVKQNIQFGYESYPY